MKTLENLSGDSFERLFAYGCMFETLWHINKELENAESDERKIRNIRMTMDVLKKTLAAKGIEEGF